MNNKLYENALEITVDYGRKHVLYVEFEFSENPGYYKDHVGEGWFESESPTLDEVIIKKVFLKYNDNYRRIEYPHEDLEYFIGQMYNNPNDPHGSWEYPID